MSTRPANSPSAAGRGGGTLPWAATAAAVARTRARTPLTVTRGTLRRGVRRNAPVDPFRRPSCHSASASQHRPIGAASPPTLPRLRKWVVPERGGDTGALLNILGDLEQDLVRKGEAEGLGCLEIDGPGRERLAVGRR